VFYVVDVNYVYMESTSYLPVSNGLSKSISIESNNGEFEVSWVVSNENSESCFLASFTYQSEEKLVEREFTNRVFNNIEEASAVKQVITDVTTITTDVKATDRVVGACTPNPISETISDISKICTVIDEDVSLLFDYVGDDDIKNSDARTVINTGRRAAMGISSQCTKCTSISPLVRSIETIVEPDKLKPSLLAIQESIGNIVSHALLLASARDNLSMKTSSDSNKILEILSEIIYKIEPKVFRLTQLSTQVDNWISHQRGTDTTSETAFEQAPDTLS
jgi:hypothetical protein